MMRWAMGMTALALAAGASLAQEPTYALTKRTVFRPGDVMDTNHTSEERTETARGGNVLETIKSVYSSALQGEVLAVDANGTAVEIRVTIRSLEIKETVESTGGANETKRTVVRDLSLTGKREGDRFTWNTAALVAKEPNALRASEIALLKLLVGRPSDCEGDARLMPKGPVPLGYTWEPSAEDLRKWVGDGPQARAFSLKVRRARLTLAGVSGGTATVEGNIAISASKGGKGVDVDVAVRFLIDTQTGRWIESGDRCCATADVGEVKVKFDTAGKTTVKFTLGTGVASAPPAWKNQLGWAKPAQDTNSFKDKKRGVSLDVPKDFKEVEVKKPGVLIAKFQLSDDGNSVALSHSIAVTLTQLPILVELEDLTGPIIDGMKESVLDYKVVRQTPVTLPNNVPSVLVTAVAYEGKLNIITILALDGKKFVSVTLAAPADSKMTAEKLADVAKTLRLFDTED